MRGRLLVLFVSTLFVAVGCVNKVAVMRIEPAVVDMPRVNSLAIVNFDGANAELLQSHVTEELVSSGRFQVLDRKHIELARAELVRAKSRLYQRRGLRPGEWLLATAIVDGAVHETADQEHVEIQKVECSKEIKKERGESYECLRSVRHAEVTCSAEIRITQTTTVGLLVSKLFSSRQVATSESSGGEPPTIDENPLFTDCRKDVAQQFIRYVAPHRVKEDVVLEDDDDLPALETGNTYARNNDWSKALDYYRKARDTAEASRLPPKVLGRAYYSVGVGLAMIGEYEEAIAEIDKAITQEPSKVWIEFQVRIKNWQRDRERLQEQSSDMPSRKPLSLNQTGFGSPRGPSSDPRG